MAVKTKQPNVKVMKDRGTGTIFYVTGPLSEVMRLTREGLGMTREQLAEDAKVCLSTIYRRETDTNMKGSWGYLRTNVQIMNALGLQLLGMKD